MAKKALPAFMAKGKAKKEDPKAAKAKKGKKPFVPFGKAKGKY